MSLYFDLRNNPIKDKHFWLVHWKRFQPQTFRGWLVSSRSKGTAKVFVLQPWVGVASLPEKLAAL